MIQLSTNPQLSHLRYHPDILEKAIVGISSKDPNPKGDLLNVARNIAVLAWPVDSDGQQRLVKEGHANAIAGTVRIIRLVKTIRNAM